MSTLALFIPIMLAWRPLLDPLDDLHGQWASLILMPPLVVAIALIYKTLKMPSLERLAVETLSLTAYILVLMAAAALILFVIVDYVIR